MRNWNRTTYTTYSTNCIVKVLKTSYRSWTAQHKRWVKLCRHLCGTTCPWKHSQDPLGPWCVRRKRATNLQYGAWFFLCVISLGGGLQNGRAVAKGSAQVAATACTGTYMWLVE